MTNKLTLQNIEKFMKLEIPLQEQTIYLLFAKSQPTTKEAFKFNRNFYCIVADTPRFLYYYSVGENETISIECTPAFKNISINEIDLINELDRQNITDIVIAYHCSKFKPEMPESENAPQAQLLLQKKPTIHDPNKENTSNNGSVSVAGESSSSTSSSNSLFRNIYTRSIPSSKQFKMIPQEYDAIAVPNEAFASYRKNIKYLPTHIKGIIICTKSKKSNFDIRCWEAPHWCTIYDRHYNLLREPVNKPTQREILNLKNPIIKACSNDAPTIKNLQDFQNIPLKCTTVRFHFHNVRDCSILTDLPLRITAIYLNKEIETASMEGILNVIPPSVELYSHGGILISPSQPQIPPIAPQPKSVPKNIRMDLFKHRSNTLWQLCNLSRRITQLKIDQEKLFTLIFPLQTLFFNSLPANITSIKLAYGGEARSIHISFIPKKYAIYDKDDELLRPAQALDADNDDAVVPSENIDANDSSESSEEENSILNSSYNKADNLLRSAPALDADNGAKTKSPKEIEDESSALPGAENSSLDSLGTVLKKRTASEALLQSREECGPPPKRIKTKQSDSNDVINFIEGLNLTTFSPQKKEKVIRFKVSDSSGVRKITHERILSGASPNESPTLASETTPKMGLNSILN